MQGFNWLNNKTKPFGGWLWSGENAQSNYQGILRSMFEIFNQLEFKEIENVGDICNSLLPKDDSALQ